MLKLSDIKKIIREPYAWPGGYPLYFVMGDGEALSIKGARKCWREIVSAHLACKGDHRDRPSWDNEYVVEDAQINWEDDGLVCCETNERIESAYGENDDAA